MSEPPLEAKANLPLAARPTLVKHVPSGYALQWQDLKLRKRAFYTAWLLGWIPVYGIAAVIYLLFHPTGDWGFLTFILWATVFYGTGYHWSRFQCPRCGKRFFSRGFHSNSFSRKCLHCGLNIGELEPPRH